MFATFALRNPTSYKIKTTSNASSEVWTHDPWFTRPVLCHWAIEALLSVMWKSFNEIFFSLRNWTIFYLLYPLHTYTLYVQYVIVSQSHYNTHCIVRTLHRLVYSVCNATTYTQPCMFRGVYGPCVGTPFTHFTYSYNLCKKIWFCKVLIPRRLGGQKNQGLYTG